MKYSGALIPIVFCATAMAELAGTGPRLQPEDRIHQEQIVGGSLGLTEIREAGLKVFATPFNRADGLGDGARRTAGSARGAAGRRPRRAG